LRLITGDGRPIADIDPSPPSRSTLDAAILKAAHEWAALAMESSEAIDTATEEGQLRMNLIDAVHDAEHFDAFLTVRRPIQLDIFGEPPGS
jgi:hypothetical protein